MAFDEPHAATTQRKKTAPALLRYRPIFSAKTMQGDEEKGDWIDYEVFADLRRYADNLATATGVEPWQVPTFDELRERRGR